MDVDRYIAAHRATWTRLDELVQRAQVSPGRLSLDETEELLRLYQLTSAHLSHVRSNHRDRALIGGLSSRVAAARQVIYGRRGRAQRALVGFFTVGFPLAMVRSWRAIVVSAMLFFGSALATAAWFNNSPEALDVTITPEQQELIAAHEFEDYYSSEGAGVFAAKVQTNNIQVGLLALAGGATAGTLTAAVLLVNGFNVGVMGALMHQNDAAGTFWGLILPHGLLEISAIVVAGAVGLKLGWAIVAPGEDRSRAEAVTEEARTGVTIVIGLAIWFIVAGFIEALVTPSGLPTAVRIAIGILALGAAVLHVLAFGPAALVAAREGDATDPWEAERADLARADSLSPGSGASTTLPVT
ncbi:MAG: stage II sporulation protein M [Microthrixaceae bacterium]|nr:stage II sporulation protein M [Microthrixaceae bacterium]